MMSFSVVLSVQRLARTRPLLTSCLRLLSTSDPREDDLKSELVGIVSHLMVVGDKRKHLAVIITLKTELEERLTRKSNNTLLAVKKLLTNLMHSLQLQDNYI